MNMLREDAESKCLEIRMRFEVLTISLLKHVSWSVGLFSQARILD